jgi:hypothetical protein
MEYRPGVAASLQRVIVVQQAGTIVVSSTVDKTCVAEQEGFWLAQ